MCEIYDSIFRRAKEAIRRGDRPSDDWMILTANWLTKSEEKAKASKPASAEISAAALAEEVKAVIGKFLP